MIAPARFSSSAARRLSLQALSGQIGARGGRKLRRLLEGSEADREAYDRLALLFAALEQRAEQRALAEGQRQRILGELLVRTAADRPRIHAPGGIVVQLAAAAAALVLVVLSASLAPRSTIHPALSPRGSVAPQPPGLAAVRAFCVRGGAVVPPPLRSTPTDPDARCRLDDELQLMITHTARFPQLLVIGHLVEERGGERRLLWYFPAPPTGASARAPQGIGAPRALDSALRLAVNHQPGRLRIVAIFSRAPLQAETIFAYLRAMPDEGSAEELLSRLGGAPPELTAMEQRVIIEAPQQAPDRPRGKHGIIEPPTRDGIDERKVR